VGRKARVKDLFGPYAYWPATLFRAFKKWERALYDALCAKD